MRRGHKKPNKNKKPIFISFEGTEGTGKTTLIKILKSKFEVNGLKVLTTREPGGTELAEKIRSLVLSTHMPSKAEILLYEAARVDHVERIIRPALEKGVVVLCDRYTDSTLAYQGQGRGLRWSDVEWLNQFAVEKTKPNLTIWCDGNVEICLKRATDVTKFENEGLSLQNKVHRGFSKIHKSDSKRFRRIRIDDKSPEEVANEVFEIIFKKFKSAFEDVRLKEK